MKIKHKIKHVKNWFGYQRKLAHKMQRTEKEKENLQENSNQSQNQNNTVCFEENKPNKAINVFIPQTNWVNPGVNIIYMMVPINSFKNEFRWNPMFNYSHVNFIQ